METGNSKPRDERGYEASYTSYKSLEKFNPKLNHRDHGPKPETFGLTEFEAKFIRARIDRELGRTA